MKIAGIQKVTLLDFPGKVACMIFTQGCNLCCPFCQNSSLIPTKEKSNMTVDEVLDYLNLRKKILDGVVITGGEPLVQKDIKDLLRNIKELGLLIKIDTNGTYPLILKEIIEEGLVDYVAMDIKNVDSKYMMTVGKKINIDNIKKSIDILKSSKIDYEFRTTLVKEFHNFEGIKKICELVGKDSKYYLQNFEDSSDVINHNLHGFTRGELLLIYENIKESFPNVEIRALS